MAHKEVLIYINESVIKFLGGQGGVDSFIEAVKHGPEWVTRTEFCQKAYQAYDGWRNRQLEYPPYIAYLACCVLAATLEGDWDSKAFYPRLRKLLNEPEPEGTLPDIHLMRQIWKDLEKWSREDKKEELGRFVARWRGKRCNVGLPLSQTIISDIERKGLVRIFEDANLDPKDAPSPEAMPRILLRYGKEYLEKRTIKLLENSDDDSRILREALIRFVLDELETWDGLITIREEQPGTSEQVTEKRKRLMLRICLKLDTLNNTVTTYLRTNTDQEYPEEGISIRLKGDDARWSCAGAHEGWSKKIVNESNPSEALDAKKLDWANGDTLIDNDGSFDIKLKSATTRLFITGQNESLPDWIDANRLEREVEFYLACYGQDIEKVREWGKVSCGIFKELVYAGLPQGWALFHGKDTTQSCPGIDVLSLSSVVMLKLKGISIGNRTYLKIAPPEIIIENASGNEIVTLDGLPLDTKDSERSVWTIPEATAAKNSVIIEVKVEQEIVDAKQIYLEDVSIRKLESIECYRDKEGQICKGEQNKPRVHGAMILSEDTVIANSYDPKLNFNLPDKSILLGARPGEIHELAENKFEQPDWHPIWIIFIRNRKSLELHYLGSRHLKIDEILPQEPLDNQTSVKRWKGFIWRNRKIIRGPSLNMLKKVWKKYIEVAKVE